MSHIEWKPTARGARRRCPAPHPRAAQARRAFVKADWNIRKLDHEEAVPMDEPRGARRQTNQLAGPNAAARHEKRKTFAMGPHGVTNMRMTQKRQSTLTGGFDAQF